ncbi:MAG: histidine phosphatase family protein [Bacteroidales bacterium]|nr:histidine phosphatase family protein [Bacteroidales bacterium]
MSGRFYRATSGGGFPLVSQEQNDVFTIYLVRHAEKDNMSANARDPELSDTGKLRAANMALIFSETELKRIYSTNYIRTLSTAGPVAGNKGIEPEIYDAQDLIKFRDLLLSRKEDALVVGHSNTTSVLAGLLAGKDLPPMADNEYDKIFVVVIFGNRTKIHVLHQGKWGD